MTKYSFAITSGIIQTYMLKHIARDLLPDASKLSPMEDAMQKRVLAFAISDVSPDLYPDLRSAMSGSKQQFDHFFDVTQIVCEEISGE